MKDKIKQRIIDSLGWSDGELDKIIFATQDSLHDPFLYANMETLVTELNNFAQEQQKYPHKLLIVDTDYDTDGIMSAAVLSASLACFGINHRVYIPSMSDGYGLNPKAIDEMLNTFSDVSLILTADNGTNAYKGVDYANEKGIPVLVTDHHIGSTKTANAKVVVNPNTPVDFYPFKGNAGAAVAWKAMLAYAQKFAPDKTPYIYDLIVFAGIANVADVMPIIDENHFMVREAVTTLRSLQQGEQPRPIGIRGYDMIMQGLYDLVTEMQRLRDVDRASQGKKPSKLPTDEQLIGWYISPLLNAPRRVVGTPISAFKGLLHPNREKRLEQIKLMNEQNKEKSRLRDVAISSIPRDVLGEFSNVLEIHSPHGIAGLVAGHFVGQTNKPTIVFSAHPNALNDTVISGSARSIELAPLPLIVDEVEKMSPGIIVGGGGHALAAGYSIRYGDLAKFRALFDQASACVVSRILAEHESYTPIPTPINRMVFAFINGEDTLDGLHYNITTDPNLMMNLLGVLDFFDELKPFGKGFDAETEFVFLLDTGLMQKYNYNPDFWKTFKLEVSGVEILTFDIELADKVKHQIKTGQDCVIPCKCELKRNNFMGRTKPQLLLRL